MRRVRRVLAASLVPAAVCSWLDLFDAVWRCECKRCKAQTYWFDDGRQIDPEGNAGPLPNPDMPADVRDDYLEAGAIVERSPRGACALLRLATEKLLGDIGDPNISLNENIKRLHSQGELPERVVKAMDVLRVVGNNAVHPLELDLRDDRETATSLFELVNLIVEQCITGERRIDEMFERLPERSKHAIAERNAPAQLPAGS